METRNPAFCRPVVLALLALLSGAAARAQPFLGPEIALSRPASPGSQARVAAAEDGSFVAVWQTGSPRATDVLIRLFDAAGRARGPEFPVANQGRGHQISPQIAMAGNGTFVVVWLVDVTPQSGQALYRLFARRFDRDGHPRGGPFPVTIEPTAEKGLQFGPGVAIAPDGRILVAWSQDTGVDDGDGGHVFDLRARFFADDGHSLGEAFVLEAQLDQVDLARLRFARDGRLFVLCEEYGGEPTFFDVFLKRFSTNGAPLGEAIRLNNDPETLPASQHGSDFAIGADGNLFVVWTDNAADFVRHPAEHLVGFDGLGLVGQRVSAAGELLGSPIAINRFFRGEQDSASVAATADGGFFVVWTGNADQDGSGFGVFGRRYDASGTPVSREYILPLTRANNQTAPAIALNSKGQGVVAWSSAKSGALLGLFARLFKG
jgi:hypothetical protein